MCNFWTLSPSHGLGRASPLPEGALAPTCLFRQADTTFSGGVFGRFLRILHLSYSVMHVRSHPLRDAPGCAWIFPRTKKVFAGHFFTPPSVGPSFQIPPSPPKKRHHHFRWCLWRRRRDLNPRYPFGVYAISNRARSATTRLLHKICLRAQLAYNTTYAIFCQALFLLFPGLFQIVAKKYSPGKKIPGREILQQRIPAFSQA